MASAPRPSSRPRQTWRERSRASESTVEARRVKRWLSSILLLLLVGTLAWLVWQFYLKPRIHFANLSVTQYSRYGHAVPPAPYFENDAEYLGSIDSKRLDGYETFDAMSNLAGRLNEIVPRPDRDLLVLYVSAHGISLDGGGKPEAYLLCSDFDAAKGIRRDGGGLPVSEFLRQVSKCQARVKIIILDAGHLSTEPRLGVIVNEFPNLLEAAVKDTKDENLWVLSANSMHESSHVAHGRRQSIFNYFVVRGLTGDENGKVDLAELVSFVKDNVRTWMESHYGKLETQTPKILWGGGDIVRKDDIVARMRAVVLPIQRTKPTVAAEDAQKTEPSTPKVSDPGKPKTESAVDAMLRDRGGLLGRLTRPSGVGLLSLAGSTAPEQSAAGPAAPTKASGDAAAAASDLPVETAKPAAESKKADAGKAEPESKKAPPAAEQKAAAPTPDAADKTSSPDKAPPAASGSAPQQGAVKKEKEDDKAARTKNDKWSAVQSRWAKRDALMRPVDSAGWTPIDYAPLHWRRFESEILDSEARYPDRDKKVEGGQIEPADFDRERQKFLATNERREQSGPIHEALKVRNRAIYRAIDLVAWHARASWAQQEQLGEYEDIKNLLSDLAQLERSLAAAVKGPDDDEGTDSENFATLESRCNAVANRLKAIEKRLNEQASQAVKFVARDANTHGVARTIEDLLSIPLENTDLRINLLKALEQTGKVPAESKGDKKVAEAQILDEVLSPQKDPERHQPWSRAIEQARLETLLAGLANSDASKELLKFIPQSNEGREGERQQIRTLSPKLADYYRELRLRIDKSSESTPRAERELRLFPLALTAELRPTKNPILDRQWRAPPKRGFAFDFEVSDPLVLGPATEGTEIKGTIAAKGGFTGKVKLSLAFDSNKLKIDDMSASDSRTVERNMSRNISFDSDHPSITLRYRVSPLDLPPRATAGLTLTAEAAGNPGQRETLPINFQSPAPDSIELVVSPAASGEYLAKEADLDANRSLITGSITGTTESSHQAASLATFPGHVTSFVLKLKHDSGRKRKVSVDLLGVSETDYGQIEQLRRLAKTKPIELLKPRTGVQKLASVPEMELDKFETAGAPIQFPPPKAPPADGKGANATTDASKAPPPPSIVGGLLVIVRDKEKEELGPWVTWIDVAPWGPWQYVSPTVEYDGQRQLTVKLGLVDRARPLDGRPITVALEESNEIRRADIIGSGTDLNEKENQYKSQLVARVDRDRTKQAEVRLTVDGYPRAFIYKIPLDGPQKKKLDDRQSTLERIQIVQPIKDDYFKADEELDVRVRVVAPEASFRDARQGKGDRVELSIDKTGDGTIETLGTQYTDREHDITIKEKEIGVDGRVSINTEVKDLEFHLRSQQLNRRATIVAKLILDDRSAGEHSVEVAFDQTPPQLKLPGSHDRVVHRGEKLTLEIEADDRDSSGDELSGVKSVKYVVGTLDDETRKGAKNVPLNPRTGKYELNFEIPADFTLGPHTLHFWATDNVGLESETQILSLDVRPSMVSDGKTPGPALKGKIEGTVVSDNKPVPRATVQIVEGTGMTAVVKQETKSDDNGQFVFKDLEPGTYQLRAEGTFRNGFRKAPAISVTMPKPAKTVKAPPLKMQ